MENPGPFTRSQLAQMGVERRHVSELLSQGRLHRVSRGWFAESRSPEPAVRAVQLGGRLGCLSACELHELWVPHQTDLHVALNPGAPSPTVPPRAVQFHRLVTGYRSAVLPVADAVAQVLHRHDEETGLIVLESAVNRGALDQAEAEHLLATVPMRARRAAQHFSPLAQSGSETRLRLFFQRRGVPVQPQVFIPGVGRVDLLVGRSWILEADSRAFHTSPSQIAVDRGRDFESRGLGFMTDRLGYEQLWHSWDLTQRWLLAVLRTRRHLQPPVPLRAGR
ncbi:MAG: type IV toxin-antitoxin system AbiEi family antitoxin domain-containing protein [Nesterenkonia sp.]|nr:type IV toxin-antitoxin system AbiEi family antitoxin domain-containing protein [Nesterenkonia sp.]